MPKAALNPGKKKLMVAYSSQETSMAAQYCTLWFTRKLSKLRFCGLLRAVVTYSERWNMASTIRYKPNGV